MRVQELAKELGLTSNELLDYLRTSGIEASNRFSLIEDDDADPVREAVRTGALKPKPLPTPLPPPPPPPPRKVVLERPLTDPPPPPVKAVPPSRPVAPPPPAPLPVAAAPAATKVREGKPATKEKPKGKEQEPPLTPAAAASDLAVPTAPTAAVPLVVVPSPAAESPKAEIPPASKSKIVQLKGTLVVKDLAELLGMRPNQVIRELMAINVMASINERIDHKVAQKILETHGFVIEQKKTEHKGEAKKTGEEKEQDRPEDLGSRPPVVTFLGHVDHGKTSLLDRIRNASVAKGEAGGITQHIGAYTVEANGKQITFLDTPGHEAFTAMRARGANMTDIAVIIIAADDGIMPQTKEAIKHAQAAKVAIMVAINKCDLPAANPTRVKQQLAAEGLNPEEWGGTVIVSEVSAVTGQGIDRLLEMILLQAEVLELKANPKRRAKGYVIEARLEAGMGPTITLLVQNGTLKLGDVLLCGPYCGKVKALVGDKGAKVKSAGPGTPVQCLGLPGVPEAGAEFEVHRNEKSARVIAEQRQQEQKSAQIIQPKRVSLDSLFQQMKDDAKVEIRLILKADVQGSIEAIEHSLREIDSQKVALNILLSGVGTVTMNDVQLAAASEAIIIGFHVGMEDGVSKTAKQKGVEIRLLNIIYELIDQVRNAMAGLLTPILREKILGHAEVKQTFSIAKGSVVAGCMATDGVIGSRNKARVKRENEVIYEGTVISLRRFQNDVAEVRESQECGIRLDNFAGFQPGDIIEFYEIEKIAQTL